MATSVMPSKYDNGYREPSVGRSWERKPSNGSNEEANYDPPPSVELLTSPVHNSLGLNVLRTWPTLYDGTNSPHGPPEWWKPAKKVDVLIAGAGPSGLQVAVSLARQGVSFRIIGQPAFLTPLQPAACYHGNFFPKCCDKASGPLIAGRADGVQPRFLETLHCWGLATEVHEEGPLIERTAIYKDGKKLLFRPSHQSDSRYRGLHIITQGQIERIYVRDLLRQKQLVERETVVSDFRVDNATQDDYPVKVALKNERTGLREDVEAKFLVGADGAGSFVRKKLQIPFDGVSTDIYWGIMDAVFESDYPHAWVFGSVISSKHGGCVIIPREDGYIRLYTQLDVSATGPISQSRQGRSASFQEEGGHVEASTITAEEVLEQANRIFAPYKLKFASTLSWFTVWKISERVARSFSSSDHRVHLIGDAAHIHSVMGAFGLNASILDSSNLAWKLGLAARGISAPDVILPTFNKERRDHAKRIIRISGSYLRFICNSELPIASYADAEGDEQDGNDGAVHYVPGNDQEFLRDFFAANGHFLLGLDVGCKPNVVSPAPYAKGSAAIAPRNGVRAPNPRVCLDASRTGYLYDALTGAATLHIVLFASDLQGPVRKALKAFSAGLAAPGSFFRQYGGRRLFNVVLLTKCAIDEAAALLKGTELAALHECATVLYDDRAPDEDAHTYYGVDHAKGAAVFVRPDLWVGTSAHLGDVAALDAYFGQWLLPVKGAEELGQKPVEVVFKPIANGLGHQVNAGTNGDSHPLSNGNSELVTSH